MTGDPARHKHTGHHTAAGALRVGGCLLIISCLLASLVNQTSFKSRLTSSGSTTATIKHTKTRREKQLLDLNATTAIGDVLLADLAKKAPHAPIDLVLPKLPTLSSALDSSDVVAVYFGAAWCQKSRQFANRLNSILGPKLRQQRTLKRSSNTENQPLSILYVSSDRNKMLMKNFAGKFPFTKVPWDTAERKLLKRRFKVCAKTEQEVLQLQREHEIPYLLVFSGKTHKLISKTGVEDLKIHGLGVLDHWTDLARGNKRTSIAK